MRFYEIIAESDNYDDIIEDGVDARGDAVLATALELLRASAIKRKTTLPQVQVSALVNMVNRLPGGETFSAASLQAAKDSNDIIDDIKDDEKTGIKYVHLDTGIESPNEDDEMQDDSEKSQKVVDQMASRAAR